MLAINSNIYIKNVISGSKNGNINDSNVIGKTIIDTYGTNMQLKIILNKFI